MLDYDVRRHIPRVKKSLSNYIGVIGEKLALKYLIENGFNVTSFMGCVNEALGVNKSERETLQRSNLWKKELGELKELEKTVKELFGKSWSKFVQFCEAWKEESDFPHEKSIDKYHFGFDYVVKKDSNIYLVDVKTNKAKLRKYQRKMMLRAKEFGFIPMIVRPKVSIIARIEDVTVEKI